MENALAWAITKHKIPSLMETPIDEWPNLSRVRGRWILWNTREGQPYQAELERLVAEYREPPPDYTDPAQADRLIEIAAVKLSAHTAAILYRPADALPWIVELQAWNFHRPGRAATRGDAVLAACYNAIPEEERK